MEKYTIHDITEETCCVFCGAPLYVNDTAYMRNDERIVCGKNCSIELDLYETGFPRCPACDGSDSSLLGILGYLAHFRCDCCGSEFSHRIN